LWSVVLVAAGCEGLAAGGDTDAWFVLDAVAGMDLSEFYGAYRADGVGRRAYDPAVMVALLLYGYSRGIRSARKIERACEEDVAFKLIAMLETPDHATIARFVERHEAALAELFGQVLGLCAGRSGEAGGGRGRWDADGGQREPRIDFGFRPDRAGDPRGGESDRRG
jgi:hypothetical protein